MTEPLRVAIFGPESTGKTTLAAALAARFDEPSSPEYVREYWESHGGVIGPGDLDTIARGQIAGEEATAARARRMVFNDTDLVTCVLWDDLLFPGSCPPWVRVEAERRARCFALYLLCDTDLPWLPDPQRCFPDEIGRAMCRRRWEEALAVRCLPYVWIRGDWAQRERLAATAIEKVLSRCGRT